VRFYFGTGPSSLDYWRVVVNAKPKRGDGSRATIAEVTKEAGVTMPRPLPSTARAWSAFMRVYSCRHAGLNGYLGPCWADIKAVLEVWGDWGPTIQRQLGTCFNEVMRIDSAARTEKQAQEKAKRRVRGRGSIRPRARGRR
jgi:hypothetical protein